MSRDYYVVLGIAHSATPEEVRAAFRRRSKELHPDLTGAASEPFLELREAYSVLSDPARRRAYDEDSIVRVHVRAARRAPHGSAVPLHPRGPHVVLGRRPVAEPIAPGRPVSIDDDFQSLGPSVDQLFDRWARIFGA